MAVQNPPMFLRGGGTSQHPAEDMRQMLESLVSGRGGIVDSGDFAVTQNGTPNMSVNVATGKLFLPGTENTYQGVYHCENRGSLNVTVPAANATNPRKDMIVARIRDNDYGSGPTNSFAIELIQGTAAASPVDPTIPDNCWVIARIAVGAAVTTIVTANITDLRTSYLHASGHIGQQGLATGLNGVQICTTGTLPTVGIKAGQLAWCTDNEGMWRYNGSTWSLVTTMPTAWVSPTLLNSWVNWGSPYQGLQYRKVGDIVHLRGLVKFGTVATTIFTLPSGFRPPADLMYLTLGDGAAVARFDVKSSGNVDHVSGSNTAFGINCSFSTT
jgi:hypothetical protein